MYCDGHLREKKIDYINITNVRNWKFNGPIEDQSVTVLRIMCQVGLFSFVRPMDRVQCLCLSQYVVSSPRVWSVWIWNLMGHVTKNGPTDDSDVLMSLQLSFIFSYV